MIRIVASFLILSVITPAIAQDLVEELRMKFQKAVEDTERIEPLRRDLDAISDTTPLITAYRASVEAMMAQVVWNPISKYKQVLLYDKLMSEAVHADSSSLEIRFLRLSIEYNLPKFLGMSEHVEKDKKFIVENLDQIAFLGIDPYYSRFILFFLKNSELYTDEQLIAMKAQLDANGERRN